MLKAKFLFEFVYFMGGGHLLHGDGQKFKGDRNFLGGKILKGKGLNFWEVKIRNFMGGQNSSAVPLAATGAKLYIWPKKMHFVLPP